MVRRMLLGAFLLECGHAVSHACTGCTWLTSSLPSHSTPRRSGAVERQLRLRVGKLPFAYWTEPEGKFLYIMDSAVTTYSSAADPSGSGVAVPVPPCIRALDAAGGATAVTLEVDDRARATGILKVSADAVRLQLKTSIVAEGAAEELLGYLRGILGEGVMGKSGEVDAIARLSGPLGPGTLRSGVVPQCGPCSLPHMACPTKAGTLQRSGHGKSAHTGLVHVLRPAHGICRVHAFRGAAQRTSQHMRVTIEACPAATRRHSAVPAVVGTRRSHEEADAARHGARTGRHPRQAGGGAAGPGCRTGRRADVRLPWSRLVLRHGLLIGPTPDWVHRCGRLFATTAMQACQMQHTRAGAPISGRPEVLGRAPGLAETGDLRLGAACPVHAMPAFSCQGVHPRRNERLHPCRVCHTQAQGPTRMPRTRRRRRPRQVAGARGDERRPP